VKARFLLQYLLRLRHAAILSAMKGYYCHSLPAPRGEISTVTPFFAVLTASTTTGSGGFGVTSLGHVSPAAFLGAAMQNVYRALSKLTNHTTIPALDAVDFAKSPVVQGILVSIKLLREQGITDDQLKSVLPAE
jgi:hypothetical protein